MRCMKHANPGVSVPAGWKGAKTSSTKGGRIFLPDGYTPEAAQISHERREAMEREETERADRNRRKAITAWRKAEQNHPAVRWYVQGRGIDTGELPGGVVPSVLRFNPATIDTYDQDARRWNTAAAIVAAVQGPDRKLRGVHRTYLELEQGKAAANKRSEDSKKQLGPCTGGAIRLYSGTESGVLVLAEGIETALACLQATGTATWCCMDTSKLAAVELPAELVAAGRSSSVAVVIVAGDLDRNQAGQKAASITANRLRAAHPWLQVVVRLPSSSCCPQLVEQVGEADAPRQGKGVDWLDVLQAGGTKAVREGLLGGIDVQAARRRALEWNVRAAAAGGAAGGGNNSGAGQAGPGGGQPPAPRFIDDSPVKRAEQFLLENETPAANPAGSGFLLRYWAGKWWEHNGRVYQEVLGEVVQARVWRWLDQFYALKRGAQVPLAPTGRTADDVLRAVIGPTNVAADAMPVWVPATFSDDGTPRWADATAHVRRAGAQCRPAGGIVAFQNKLMDLDAWARGELRALEHTPLYFSATCLPFDLPVPELEQALADGNEHALIGKLCPTWLKFLSEIYGEELGWHDTLQEWFGYNLIPDNRLEKMLLLVGPPRSGKGTILTALQAMLGPANTCSLSLQNLTERFGLAELVGKLAAILPDAHLGRFTDATQAVEVLKSITGNDPVRIEEKYGKRAASLRLPVRFTIACNELPNLQDSSLALHGRTIVLRTERSHQGSEDTGLKGRILAEAPGIMLWALFGLRRLWTRSPMKLEQPTSGAELLLEIAREQSPVTAFLEDACILESSLETPIGEMYHAWELWAEATHRSAGSPETFGRKLRAAVPNIRVVNRRTPEGRVRLYAGIRPHPDYVEKTESTYSRAAAPRD